MRRFISGCLLLLLCISFKSYASVITFDSWAVADYYGDQYEYFPEANITLYPEISTGFFRVEEVSDVYGLESGFISGRAAWLNSTGGFHIEFLPIDSAFPIIYVSLDLADYGDDADDVSIYAYSNYVLQETKYVHFLQDPSYTGNAERVVFDFNEPIDEVLITYDTSSNNPSLSVYVDNITFSTRPLSEVPEPASMGLLLLGISGIFIKRRK